MKNYIDMYSVDPDRTTNLIMEENTSSKMKTRGTSRAYAYHSSRNHQYLTI